MKFNQIWDKLLEKDKRLSDDNATVEFKSGNLKRLLEQVYKQGEKSAKSKRDIADKLFGKVGMDNPFDFMK